MRSASSIGVIGNGVVGSATARAFMEWADVRCYDADQRRRTHSLKEAASADVVFLCLPTPRLPGNHAADVSAVEEVCGGLSVINPDGGYVLRSTVPVGTTRRLRERYGLVNLVHSPEFLTARCAATDAQTPSRNIVGGAATTGASLADVYRERFPGVPCLLMTSDESELTKLVLNAFFAVKVAFFNEARELADASGCDWDAVVGGVLSDGRVAHAHTRVPGPDGRRGFGGECLPKDAASFLACSARAGLGPAVVAAALARNEADRRKSV